MGTTQVYVTIHGHFYQPPRENPYLEAIERQEGADPFHDWNERIFHECYRPNAFARVVSDSGEILDIINNFEYLSFNIGPTLFNWLERYDLETYQRIIEADRRSCQRLNGHGNAIAQVYNHIIMPLASTRDKFTQVRWAKQDFISRFGREPEGIWLAETAIDYETLAVLVAEGFKFTIIAPSQAQRCRPLGGGDWLEVGGGQIDPTRPYRCRIPDEILPEWGKNREIAIFVYDGPISGDMGFGEVLNSSHNLVGRLGMAVQPGRNQLVAVATDGETFGHHKKWAERTIAYALTRDIPQRGWQVTNFAHYLSLYPPTWEVMIKPRTAWSCAHGIERWRSDCGCGGGGSWHQKWRAPLRQSLDWLAQQLDALYEEWAGEWLADPWEARDAYIQVIRERTQEGSQRFLASQQRYPLTVEEQVDVLRLLEMQRYRLFMFTSCGWFFDELSRPEGVQILRYAARAMELAQEVTGQDWEPEFRKRLALAPSNIPQYVNGEAVYQQRVETARVTMPQVAAHYGISSLYTQYPRQQQIYCYNIEQQDYQIHRLGTLTLAVGELVITSVITWEQKHLIMAVLHLGGWDFHCCLQEFSQRKAYQHLREQLLAVFQAGSGAQTVLAMGRLFEGQPSYGLQDIFSQERQRIIGLLAQNTLTRLDQLYSQVYRENYGVIMAFRRDHLPVPQELQVAAAITLSQRVMFLLQRLELETSNPLHDGSPNGTVYIHELHSLTQEVKQVGVRLDIQAGRQIIERLLLTWLEELLTRLPEHLLGIGVQRWQKLLRLAELLHLHPQMERIQERYFASCCQGQLRTELLALAPLVRVAPPSCSTEPWLKPRTIVAPYLLPTVDAPGATVPTRPPAGDALPDNA
jgi:alpha-amylase/alpha-mannosidase (GH57 family)